MYILSVEQMRQAEAAADAAGQTYAVMMENAGQAVVTAVRQMIDPQGQRILVLVGPGNNGGDGLVAAFHLQRLGGAVTCYIWRRTLEGDAHFARARDAGCRVLWAQEDAGWAVLRQECEQADVVLDALLGTGIARPITGDLAELLGVVRETIERRRRARLPWIKEALQVIDPILKVPERPETPLVVAVDVPSGLNCDTGALDPAALPADVTVTFGFPKRGQFIFPGAGAVGKLLIAEIGIPPRLVKDCHLHLVTTKMVSERLPQRPLDAHKGIFGRALIIAGSVNYTGAPALAAAAAARVGAGLVTLALARSVFPVVAAKLFEPTYILLPESLGVISDEAVDVLCERLPEYGALLIGPGLGQADEVVRFVHTFLSGELRLPRRRPRIGFVETTA
ncbi:MAG: NAD(P)H-hydrate epimerase, partial [Anaerolineae bacterium]